MYSYFLSPVCSSLAEVVQWDIADVCRWLEELGLGEYCDAFQEQAIVGTKLLGLRKSDLQVQFILYYSVYISLVPRRSGGRRESAWYTLFAHAFNFPDIWENSILQ